MPHRVLEPGFTLLQCFLSAFRMAASYFRAMLRIGSVVPSHTMRPAVCTLVHRTPR